MVGLDPTTQATSSNVSSEGKKAPAIFPAPPASGRLETAGLIRARSGVINIPVVIWPAGLQPR